MFRSLSVAALLACALPAQAEFSFERTSEDVKSYVESNLLGIFYHEFGHALIDVMELPIFGQEEDAADVLSVFLIDAFYEEEAAVQLAYDTAFGFLGEAEQSEDIAFWDVHGPDLQRYYNLVCLFYGANPDEREDVAQELGLPEERAEYCPDEFDQALHSWGGVLDEISVSGGGQSLKLQPLEDKGAAAQFTHSVMATELAALNEEFELPSPIDIRVEACGEVNAFYDPLNREITMCTEFTDELTLMAPQ